VAGLTVTLVTLVAIGGLAACSPKSTNAQPGWVAAARLRTLQQEWTLTRLGLDSKPVTLVKTAPVTMTVASTSIEGSLGCDAFATKYSATTGGSFSIDVPGVTHNHCDDAVQTQANEFIEALKDVNQYEVVGTDHLKLTGGGATITFNHPVVTDYDQATAKHTAYWGNWRLTSLTARGQTATNVPDNILITVTLTSGLARGLAGCNGYVAEISPSGANGIAIGQITMDLKACGPSRQYLSIEAQYVSSLSSATEWQMPDIDTLEFLGTGVTLTFTRVGTETAPPPLPDKV
jgi:heat shock protein HslJ